MDIMAGKIKFTVGILMKIDFFKNACKPALVSETEISNLEDRHSRPEHFLTLDFRLKLSADFQLGFGEKNGL